MTAVTPRLHRAASGALPLGVAVVASLAIWPVPHMPLGVVVALAFIPVWLAGLRRRGRLRVLVIAWLLLPVWVLARTAAAGVPVELDLENSLPSNPATWVVQALGFAIMFGFASWLLPHLGPRQVAWLFVLAALAWLTAAVLFGEAGPGRSTWKYVLAWPSSMVVVAAATVVAQRGASRAALAMVGSMGLVLVVTDFRSLGAILLGTVLLVALTPRFTDRRVRVSTAIVSVVAVVIGAVALGAAMEQGWLGQTAQQRWIDQGGTLFDVLRQGRPETFFGVRAAMDSPLLGIGVVPSIPAEAITAAEQWFPPMSLGARASVLERIADSGVNLHSVVLDWWVVAGLAGLILTGIILVKAVIVACSPRSRIPQLQPLQLYAALGLAWDLLFSPWTYFSGPTWGVFAALVFLSPSWSRGQRREVQPDARHATAEHRHDQPQQRLRA